MKTKQELLEIIQKSSLDQDNKDFWNKVLQNEKIQEKEVTAILEVIKEDSNVLEFLTKNLKDKINLVQKEDKTLKKKIAADEAKFLNQNT